MPKTLIKPLQGHRTFGPHSGDAPELFYAFPDETHTQPCTQRQLIVDQNSSQFTSSMLLESIGLIKITVLQNYEYCFFEKQHVVNKVLVRYWTMLVVLKKSTIIGFVRLHAYCNTKTSIRSIFWSCKINITTKEPISTRARVHFPCNLALNGRFCCNCSEYFWFKLLQFGFHVEKHFCYYTGIWN